MRILLLILLPTLAANAIVNTEKLRPRGTARGMSALVDAALEFSRGNLSYTEVGALARVEYSGEVHKPFIEGNFAFAEENGEGFENSVTVHARWTAMWLPYLGSEVFSQYEYDDFRQIGLRALLGGGGRLRMFTTDLFEGFLGTGLMAEQMNYDIAATDTHPVERLNIRSTSYLSLRFYPVKTIVLFTTAYFQPRVDLVRDYRALFDVGVGVDIIGSLELQMVLSHLYDNDSPDELKAYDTRVEHHLVYRFRPKAEVSE